MNSARPPQFTPYVSPHPWGRNLWGALLDTSVYWSFDRTGFERHERSFQELTPAHQPSTDQPLRVMITGANSGIGYACAEALCALGVEVLMVCRDEQRGAKARDELISKINPQHAPLLITGDLHDLRSIEGVVEKTQAPLHGLIHNAGLLPAERVLNHAGVEQCVGVHLLGPALLTERLHEQLREGGEALQRSVGRGARVVWLSSGGMYTKPVSIEALKALSDPKCSYDGVSAYAYTKRAQVELAAHLHAQALEEGGAIEHHSAHPGWVYTPGVVTSLPAFTRFTQKRLRTPEQGADTCVWLSATSQALPGAFWFDREARSPHLLGHRPTLEQREALWRFVREGAGLLALAVLWLMVGLSGALSGSLSEVHASPALYTLGALDQDLPFSAAERGAGASVVAFNPAGLAWSVEEGGAQAVGLTVTRQALSVRYLPRPRGTQVTDDVYEARPINGERLTYKPLPTAELGGRGLASDAHEQIYLNLAWQTHLTKHLAVGVYTLLPLHRFELQAPSYPDERAQYFGNQLTFERWGDALEGLSTAAGLAYQPLEMLSVGVGVNLATQAIAQSDVFLGDVSYSGVSYVAPRVEVSTSVSPFGSLELRQSWGAHTVSLNASAHAPESSEVEGEGQVQVWGFPYPEGQHALPQRFQQVYRALPWRGRVGVSWRERTVKRDQPHQASDRGLALGVGWAQWSRYLNRAGESVAWSDQWEVSAGGWHALSKGRVGLDVRWRPSPVPEQIGRTSYIDPSQLATALSLVWPLSERLSLSAQLQSHRLLPRLDEKDMQALDPVVDEVPTALNPRTGELIEASEGLQTNNPGYPGYESEGWVWVGQMGLRVAL